MQNKPWERYGNSAPQPIVPPDPVQQRRDQAQTRSAEVQANVAEATAPADIAAAQAGAQLNQAKATEIAREQQQIATANQQKATRGAFRTDSVLQAIREARKIAQERGGTGVEGLLKALPATDALALKTALDPIKGNLSFGRLQEMRDESVTGGALGQVSNIELELLASTVASLDQNVDRETFLDRLDKVERYFIDAQLSNDGFAKDDPARRQAMRDQFGYTGVFEGEEPAQTAALGRADASQTASTLPPEYQAQHLRYLRDNWGQMTPESYASFRAGLDEQYGFTPDLQSYASAVPNFNAAAQQGVTPEQLGAVPNPTRDMSAIERGINAAAQSAPGAAFANATNAFAAGIPARLGGEQQNLELLREARPVSSFVGEMVGGGLGAAATGGALGIAGRGAGMLARPLLAETGHSAVMGATQDENMMRGAATGVAGALGGSLVGRQIGRAFPETFAGNAVQRADDSVPTVEQLKELANEQYAAAQAAGDVAGPEATQNMFERASRILRDESKISPTGRLSGTDTPTNEAYRLLQDYAGQQMRPKDANSVRKIIAEGVTNPDPSQRRISGMLLDEFDQWAEPALPNIGQARQTAQRYLQGQQLQTLSGLAARRGERLKGNDVGDTYRTLYGQLDEKIAKGQARFDEPTQQAISTAAQGDKFTNALRSLGKYGLGNPLTSGGIGIGGAASIGGVVDPIYAGGALTLGMLGTGARKLAEKRTLRNAQNAEMTALGGDEWAELFRAAQEVAANRAGRFLGGATGTGTVAIGRGQ